MDTTAERHKPGYSANGGNSEKVRRSAAGAEVRDTQNRGAGYLAFASQEWATLIGGVRSKTR